MRVHANMKYCGRWIVLSHFWPFVYFHTNTSASMLEIRVSIRKMCLSALWNKFCVIIPLLTTTKNKMKQILSKWSIFVFTFPSKSAYLVCPATQYHFSSSKRDSNRLLYSSVSHETRRHAKHRSQWIANHVLQMQPCRIRFYLKSAQYLCSFVFFLYFHYVCVRIIY